MSKVVEERVTEMRFDNSQFESNVKTSISTIEKLKQSLNMSGASKGLNDVSSASNGLSGVLGGALDTVRSKFSALEIIGITALANITNSAVNAGKRIVSSLTIDPIKTGFQEYETQINAIQTVLANTESKGSTLKDVNAALDELNTYADKTIYNFTEMTRNIGTFTAAGVDLKTSTSAIKGIANLAAVSGSNSQQASTAMYQLSQALASGTVKLMDWNSVVNAGMGGQVFQDALKETARAHGIAIDSMIKSEGSFRETLKEGWLTSDVLTETLSKFTGDLSEKQLKSMGYTEKQIESIIKMGKTANDAATKVKTFTQLFDTLKEAAQSGWTKSWQIMIGDFEEAKTLLTSISNVMGDSINGMSEARNNILQTWKDLGGRTVIIETITNAFKGLMSVIKPISEAFREVIPPITGEKLFAFSEGLKNLSERLKVSDDVADRIKRTFKGLFSILNIVKNLFIAVGRALGPVAGFALKVADAFLSITAVIGDYLTNLSTAIEKTNLFGFVFESLGKIFKPVVEFIQNGAKMIGDAFDAIKVGDSSGLEGAIESTKSVIKPFTKIGEVFAKILSGITNLMKTLGGALVDAFKWLGESLSDGLDSPALDKLFGFVNGGLMTGIIFGLKKIVDNLSELASGEGFLSSITGTLDSVKDTLGAYQSQLKAGTLIKIATAIAILAGSLLVLSLIDPSKLASSLVAMGGVMTELYGFMFMFEKIAGSDGFKSMHKVTFAMIGLSVSILILSNAMTKLSKLDWNEIAKGLTGIAGLSAVMVGSAHLMSKSSGKMTKSAIGLVIFAGAIKMLVSVVGELGKMDVKTLTKGLVGVGVLCAELAVFLKVADLDGMGLLKGIGLMALATSILILGSAVEKIGKLNVNQIVKGLGTMSVILTELAIFTKLTGNSKNVISTAIGMTILGGAMLILGKALENMGSLGWEQIGKGLTSVAGALGIISIAMKRMPKNMISNSLAIVILSSGLLILTNVLESLGGMEWEDIGKSLVALAGALTIIAIAVNTMNLAISGAAAILIVSAALAILAPVLKTLGAMPLSEIGIGLLALAGVFAVIGISALVLTPVIPMIAALGGAILLLGLGCLAGGLGILAFSTALASLAVVGGAGVALIIEIVKGLIGLIPLFLQKVGEGILALGQVIINGAETIVKVIIVVIESIVKAILECVPLIVETVITLLVKTLQAIAEKLPEFIQAGMDIIVGFIQGIADNIDRVVVAGTDVIMGFIKGVQESTNKVIDAGFSIMIAFINGLADTINKRTPELIEAGSRLFRALVKAGLAILLSALNPFSNAGSDLVYKGIVPGVNNKEGSAKTAFQRVVSSCLTGVKASIGSFTGAGGQLVNGLISGIKGGISIAAEWGSKLARNVTSAAQRVFDINSPSRVFKKMGMYVDQGLANGIKQYANVAIDETETMGEDTVASMRAILNNMNLDIDDPKKHPTIRPVLDMSSIERGIDTMNGLFKQKQTVSLAGVGSLSDTNLGSISTNMSNNQNDNYGVINAIKDLKNTLNKSNSGDQYNLGNITYDDGSNVSNAVKTLVRAAKIGRRT